MRSSNFAFNQFEATVEICHKALKKVYVTVNTVFEQREADRMYQLLQYLDRVGPDGVIVQDLGVAELANRHFPGLRLHASTQMNVSSSKAANFLSRRGFKRAVMARELALEELKAITQATNLETQIFVHGALCVSASGLCLFSSYLGGKSANRGLCAQACRRMYQTETGSGFYFSPDDLELISRVPELIDAGIASFKIEGRMKSAEYVGAVVSAYRHMIDNYKIDPVRALAKARSKLQGDFARSKTFFNIDGALSPEALGLETEPDLSYIRPDQAGGTGLYLGRVREVRNVGGERYALLDTRPDADADGEEVGHTGLGAAGLVEGDSLRIHAVDDSGRFTAKLHELLDTPQGFLLRFEGSYKAGDTIYLVQKRSMGKRWKNVLPKDLGRFHRFPSHDQAPAADVPKIDKADLGLLGDGIYALVGRVADLHVILSARPQAAMILFDKKNADGLRKHEKEVPFKHADLIFWLDPYFPESDSGWLQTELEYWINRGQKIFVANNVAHLGILRALRDGRGQGVTIIAGPWLYAFNSYAAAFLVEEGARFIIPPLEISKQDFQRLSEDLPKKCLMPVVFSFPPLFRIRADLTKKYDFKAVQDRDGSVYKLNGKGSYSTVTPATPFSLVDRVPFLKNEGIGKVILDFSQIDLQKPLYKQVFKAAVEGVVLPETSRFNWKMGFWHPDEGKGTDSE
jgi:putative protease